CFAAPFLLCLDRPLSYRYIPPEGWIGVLIEDSWPEVMTMKKILLALLLLGAIGPGQALANSFSGQATVVQGTLLGSSIPPVSDTGKLDAGGGSLHSSLVDVSVPGLLTAQV